MPPPVVADALGYHPVTTARLAAQTGATFGPYAPGDHTRPSPTRGPGKGRAMTASSVPTALRAAAEGLYEGCWPVPAGR